MNLALMHSRIAFRNVRRNGRRSAITIFAISFGLFCLIVFQALKVGLHQEMLHSTLGLDGTTLLVHGAGYETNLALVQPLPNPAEVGQILAGQGLTTFSARLKSQALVVAGKRSSAVLLSGIQPEAEKNLTFISNTIVEGDYLNEPGTVMLGQSLADSLQIGPGDQLTLMVQGSVGRPTLRKYTIGAIYRTELAAFDRSHIYLQLADAQQLLNAGDDLSEIAVKTSPEKAAALAAELQERFGPDYLVSPWQENAPDLRQLMELNDATMTILVVIVFIIVAMGISNTMTTVIFERFREFGTLAAMGTPPGGIVSMVVLEAVMLGLLAIVAGGLAGIACCTLLARHGLDLTMFLSNNQYFSAGHVLKAYLLPGDLLTAVAVTILTSVLAGIYPAWKASRLDPVQALVHS